MGFLKTHYIPLGIAILFQWSILYTKRALSRVCIAAHFFQVVTIDE